MNRKNIYDNYGVFVGWFDLDQAEEIAAIKSADDNPYSTGKILLATTNNKIVINVWNNTGMDTYRFADDEAEIAEILSLGGYNGDDNRLAEILNKMEY